MNTQLFEAMGKMDAKWIQEAAYLQRKGRHARPGWVRLACAAAVVCSVCAMIWMVQGRGALPVQKIAYAVYEQRQSEAVAAPGDETVYRLEAALQQGVPQGFGGLYIQDGQIVVQLCEDSEGIRQAWYNLTGIQALRFEEVRFAQTYLEGLLQHIGQGMQNGVFTSVLSAELDTRNNRVDVYLRAADKRGLKALAALDEQGKGDAFNVYLVEGIADGAPLLDVPTSPAHGTDTRLTAQQIALCTEREQQKLSFELQNETQWQMTFGEEPCLQVCVEGVWKQVPVLPGAAWHEIACVLEAGQSHTISVNLYALYGTLPPGSYRFVKVLYGQAEQAYSVYVPFSVLVPQE